MPTRAATLVAMVVDQSALFAIDSLYTYSTGLLQSGPRLSQENIHVTVPRDMEH